MIGKHHNFDYIGGTPNVPISAGDRYYSQDLARDFWYLIERLGLVGKDIVKQGKLISSGGIVTVLAAKSISWTDLVGYAAGSVLIPSSNALPPAVTSQQIDWIRIFAGTATISDITTYGAVLNGSTPNYIKIAYAEVDGLTRLRAKAAGTYSFERTASYVLTINPGAPNPSQICLGELVGNGTTNPTYTNATRTFEIGMIEQVNSDTISANVTVNPGLGKTNFVITGSPTITLPLASSWTNVRLTFKNTSGSPIINTTAPNTLDGLNTTTLGYYSTMRIFSNGTNWYILTYENHQIVNKKYALVVTPSSGTWTNNISWCIPYQTSDGIWRLKFYFTGSISPTNSQLVFTLTGVTFANIGSAVTGIWSDVGFCGTWATSGISLAPFTCRPYPNTGNLVAGVFGSNQTNWTIWGDFELASKPTWIP